MTKLRGCRLARLVGLAGCLVLGCESAPKLDVVDGGLPDAGGQMTSMSPLTGDSNGSGVTSPAGGDPDASGDQTAPPVKAVLGESCSTPGQLRCAKAAGQREQCTNGHWAPSAPCDDGSVCVDADGQQAECEAIAEVCRGRGGEVVCDGQGVMYTCDAAGLVVTASTCASGMWFGLLRW